VRCLGRDGSMSELPPNESSIGGADAATAKAVGHDALGAKTFPLTTATAAAPTAANDNFIDRTIALWRRRLGREVSREEARQITENVTGFFSVLHSWSSGESRSAANENEQPSRGEVP
jgi:hypothetical protein